MENKPLMTIRELSIGYDDRILCSNISFDLHQGECIMLCGANGSGKSTLMKTLVKENGTIMIPSRIPKIKGFTLREFIRLSCFKQSDSSGRLSNILEQRISDAEKVLNLSRLDSRDISTLSDGEFQKAGIASALVRQARVILLDEPTAFLDAESRISVLETLRNLTRGSGRESETILPAVIFSTHDLYDGLEVADRVFAIGADNEFHVSGKDGESKEEAVRSIFHRMKPHR